jgi:uncharacterized protein YndB with AHSA1/START domain
LSEAPLVAVVTETTINAPIGHVWEVLTSDATVPHWLGCMDYTRKVGATFFMQQDPDLKAKSDTSGATHCTIKKLDKPNKFVFSWFQPGTPETIVEFHLFPDGADKTLVRLIHDGWDQFPADAVKPFYDQLKSDWRSSVLPNLKRAAQKS